MNGKIHMKYPTLTIDGETYMLINSNWVDSTYLLVGSDIMSKIIKEWLKNIDTVTYEEVLEYARKLKDTGYYLQALQLLEWLIANREKAEKKYTILCTLSSMKTSCLRQLNNPIGAIEFYKDITKEDPNQKDNAPLLVSIAAAYCDIDDYDNGLLFARKACSAFAGNYSQESSGVIARIKSVLGYDCFK